MKLWRRSELPLTANVLLTVADVGIVVGSVLTAKDPSQCKDVDIVVPEMADGYGGIIRPNPHLKLVLE